MRILAALLLTVSVLAAADTLAVFGYTWTVPNPADWKIDQEGGATVLHLVTPRGPLPGPRRPIQFALADAPDFKMTSVEADVRPLKRSLIIVYAYRDAAHFDYAHLSTDTATKQPVHNGVFHVYGGERVRISTEDGPAAFAAANRWYHVRLLYDSGTGSVHVLVDGHAVPAISAVDQSLRAGKIGIGSFDETADFKNVLISEMKSMH